MPTQTELTIPYFAQLIGWVEVALRALGYQVTLVGPSRDQRAPERGWEGIRERRFDGMIILGSAVEARAVAFMADAPLAPIVALDYDGVTSLPVIRSDVQPGLAAAMRYLASCGHRNVLWVGKAPPNAPGQLDVREQIFIQEAWRNEIQGESIYCLPIPEPYSAQSHGRQIAASSYAATRARLRSGERRFTAVVGYSDPIAIGSLHAVLDHGLSVPGDVSLIGHDNWESQLTRPSLASVDLHLERVARSAVGLLLEMIQDPRIISETRTSLRRIDAEFLARESVGPASSI